MFNNRNGQFVWFIIVWYMPVGSDTMLATVTSAVRFTSYNDSISPSPLENTSALPTWQPDPQSNITKPHQCLQVLYEDIGDSR